MAAHAKTLRAQVTGGYSRKTLSLPKSLVTKIERYLKTQPGLTISRFMTTAGEQHIGAVTTEIDEPEPRSE